MTKEEKIDLIDAVNYQLMNRFMEKYSDVLLDEYSAESFFAYGRCWYLAKMLKYLFPDLTIMENRKNLHYWVKYEDVHIGAAGYDTHPNLMSFNEELEAKHYPMVELGFEIDQGKMHQVYEDMCVDLVNYILEDSYYKGLLGDVRGDVIFYPSNNETYTPSV